MKEAKLVNLVAWSAVSFFFLLASCAETHTLDSAAELAPAEVAAERSKECAGAVGLRSKCQRKQTARLEACAQTSETARAGCEHDAKLLMEVCEDLPEVAEDLLSGAVGLRSECQRKQTDRLEACAQTPETGRAGCERDAQFLMGACGDLPASPADLFCGGATADAKCKNRAAKANDVVAGRNCAGGTVCTGAATVCKTGFFWDCKCGDVIAVRTGLCACECID